MADQKIQKKKDGQLVKAGGLVLPAGRPAGRIPDKTSINLFIEEKHTGKNMAEIAIFLVFMCGVALFSKVFVQGKLDEINRLESNYHQMEAQVEEAKASLEPYEEIRAEYSHYGNGYLNTEEATLQDRMEILGLVEKELMQSDALLSMSMSGNVATLSINSAKLASVSDVTARLEESPLVTYVVVSNAATKEQNASEAQSAAENVISSMTIYFTAAGAETETEETASTGVTVVNPLSEAMENVAEGVASDLSQTDVEGNAQ